MCRKNGHKHKKMKFERMLNYKRAMRFQVMMPVAFVGKNYLSTWGMCLAWRE